MKSFEEIHPNLLPFKTSVHCDTLISLYSTDNAEDLCNMNIINSAVEAKIKHIVITSYINFELATVRKQIPSVDAYESLIDWLASSATCSDISYAVLRSSALFHDLADVFQVARSGRAYSLQGSKTFNPISESDFAALVVKSVLEVKIYSSKTLLLGGPKSYDIDSLFKEAHQACGRDLALQPTKLPGWIVEAGSVAATIAGKANLVEKGRVLKVAVLKFASVYGMEGEKIGTDKLEPFFENLLLGIKIGEEEGGVEERRVVVSAGEKFEVKIPVEEGVKCEVSYDFSTLYYDIGFGILHGTEEKVEKWLRPLIKWNSHEKTVSDVVELTESGYYALVWDNSYSRMRSKTLKYKIKITRSRSGSISSNATQGASKHFELFDESD